MARFLTWYLIVTGVGAFLALSMPALVLVGMFLILPGLFLWFAPTGFMWGVVFAAIWFGTRVLIGDWPARALALLGTTAAMWLIPQPSIALSRARLAQATLPDVTPAAPLAIAGDVRIDLPMPTQEPYDPEHPNAPRQIGCNGMCAAALFTEGVKSVTIGKSPYVTDAEAGAGQAPSRESRTFVRRPRAACETSLRPTDAQEIGLKPAEITAKLAEWNLRLSTSDCIDSAPTPDRFDLYIVRSAGSLYGRRWDRPGWSTQPGAVDFERLEMRGRDGALLMRRSIVRTEAMALPLSISFGSNFNNFGPGWSRAPISNAPRYAMLDLGALLAAHTRLRVQVDQDATVARARARLREMLDDPRVTADDSGWAAVETYFTGLGKSVGPEDRTMIPALIRDPRNRHFEGLWSAIRALGPDAAILREPFVARLASDPNPAEQTRYIGRAIDTLPPGIFAVPSDAERALLADPLLRGRAPGLVMRQADRGAAAVPDLLSILEDHLRGAAAAIARRDTSRSADREMIDAVRVALCRLGPQGASALPRIAALDARGILSRRLDQDEDWQVALIRLGRSAETMAKPANRSGTEAQYRARQQARAADRPEMACRSSFV